MRRFLGQQLGAFVYKDPQLQIANHDLSESAGTFWTTGYNTLVSTPTLSNLNVEWQGSDPAQILFWGDATSSALFSGINESKTWSTQISSYIGGTASAYYTDGTPSELGITNAKITETSNHYMDKTFIRGSSKVLKKLI